MRVGDDVGRPGIQAVKERLGSEILIGSLPGQATTSKRSLRCFDPPTAVVQGAKHGRRESDGIEQRSYLSTVTVRHAVCGFPAREADGEQRTVNKPGSYIPVAPPVVASGIPRGEESAGTCVAGLYTYSRKAIDVTASRHFSARTRFAGQRGTVPGYAALAEKTLLPLHGGEITRRWRGRLLQCIANRQRYGNRRVTDDDHHGELT